MFFSSLNQWYDIIICVHWFELFFTGEWCGPWASCSMREIFQSWHLWMEWIMWQKHQKMEVVGFKNSLIFSSVFMTLYVFSFSDQNLSVVRRPRCLKLLTFSSSSQVPLDQFQPNLAGTQHPLVMKIQVCSTEGPCHIPRGDYYEIAKIHWQNLKIFFYRMMLPMGLLLSVRK